MRFLHWLMAALVLTMLGIGVAMVASLGDYHLLVSIHRPLGIAILILVVIRFINRQFSTLPPFPPTMSSQERLVAHASELLLYTLLFVLPLVGWGMLSAARFPIALYGSMHLPPILSAQCDVVRVSTEDPHRSRLPFVSGVPRAFWSGFVSHPRCAGRLDPPNVAEAGPRALTELVEFLWRRTSAGCPERPS